MAFISLAKSSQIKDNAILRCDAAGESYLVVRCEGEIHILENRCGHMEVPLDDGDLKEGTIRCSVHGIRFDLKTGHVTNRPWEDCRSIATYKVVMEGEDIGLILPD